MATADERRAAALEALRYRPPAPQPPENRTEPNRPPVEYTTCSVCCAIHLTDCTDHHAAWHAQT